MQWNHVTSWVLHFKEDSNPCMFEYLMAYDLQYMKHSEFHYSEHYPEVKR